MNYRKLAVWKKSFQLADDVYRIINRLPPEEIYALSSQIRRAVISISSNIAEGAGRNSNNDLRYFMSVARGSANELENQLMFTVKAGFFSKEEIRPLMESLREIKKMLTFFVRHGEID